MNPVARINPGLRDIFRMGVREIHAYRVWLVLGVFQVLLQLLLLRAIWQAVYGGRDAVEGVPIDTMITYLTIIGLLEFMTRFEIAGRIQQRIDEDRVAVDMVRPVSFVKQMVSLTLGYSAGEWVALVVVIPALLLAGSLAPPAYGVFLVFLASFVLAYTVNLLISLLIGLSSFWLISAGGMRAVVMVSSGLLSGALVPVWFMPEPLRTVVEWLPFQATAFLPASIYVEQAQGWEMWRALGVQAVWVVALWATSAFMWRRAQNRLVVQGG